MPWRRRNRRRRSPPSAPPPVPHLRARLRHRSTRPNAGRWRSGLDCLAGHREPSRRRTRSTSRHTTDARRLGHAPDVTGTVALVAARSACHEIYMESRSSERTTSGPRSTPYWLREHLTDERGGLGDAGIACHHRSRRPAWRPLGTAHTFGNAGEGEAACRDPCPCGRSPPAGRRSAMPSRKQPRVRWRGGSEVRWRPTGHGQ